MSLSRDGAAALLMGTPAAVAHLDAADAEAPAAMKWRWRMMAPTLIAFIR